MKFSSISDCLTAWFSFLTYHCTSLQASENVRPRDMPRVLRTQQKALVSHTGEDYPSSAIFCPAAQRANCLCHGDTRAGMQAQLVNATKQYTGNGRDLVEGLPPVALLREFERSARILAALCQLQGGATLKSGDHPPPTLSWNVLPASRA